VTSRNASRGAAERAEEEKAEKMVEVEEKARTK
jgi:hypothetical protein